ncbi:MAG: CPBP family intramembrane metalloprotease [Kurthia sp.]|nr:CPBP family intramembrane metalloprotease [Candidatus Kurthia equi]
MNKKTDILFIIFTLTIIVLMIIAFKNKEIFWYTYSFTLLLGMALAFSQGEIMDRLSTTRYFLIGLSFGIIGYLVIKLTYTILPYISVTAFSNVKELLETYSPTNIWQYVLLIVLIVAGEEMLWRAYIQQVLKKYFSVKKAIVFSSIHFALPLLFCGFYIGALAALLSGIIFGMLYEWLKSLPLLIVAHLIMVLLLFLLLPLT